MQIFRRRRVALCVVAAGVIVGASFVLPRFWWKVLGAEVSINGSAAVHCDVFQTFGGRYLVTVPEHDFRSAYVIDREDSYTMQPSVSIPNPIRYAILPGCVVSYDAPIMLVDTMPGVKAETDPQLVLHQRIIAFTSEDLKRVRVVL